MMDYMVNNCLPYLCGEGHFHLLDKRKAHVSPGFERDAKNNYLAILRYKANMKLNLAFWVLLNELKYFTNFCFVHAWAQTDPTPIQRHHGHHQTTRGHRP